MNQRLKIYFRQHQLQKDGVDVVVNCGAIASYVNGTVDKPDWEDVTMYTEGLDKLTMSWSAVNQSSSPSAETNQAGSNYDKGITADFEFFGYAFDYIFEFLLNNPCGILNAIDVKIEDLLCDKEFRVFEIKADNIRFVPEEGCRLNVKLREQDPAWHAVHKTFIYDNWQNWFQNGSGKQHPCFLTCVDREDSILSSARLGLNIVGKSFPFALFGLVGFLLDFLIDEEKNDKARRILGLGNFTPAPFVRDIIANFCDKYGFTYDTIFDDLPENAYRDLCLFYPIEGAVHRNDEDSNVSPALWFYNENRWLVTMAEFLDKLKLTFGAEWYITPNNELLFKPKGFFESLAPIYDFTTGNLTVELLAYEFAGSKKPAYGRYQYAADGSDLLSQEISSLYNDIVDYDGPYENLMLEGEKTKSIDFAATAFVKDGKGKNNYIRQTINDAEKAAYAIVILFAVVVVGLIPGVDNWVAAGALAALVGTWIAIIPGTSNSLRSIFDSASFWGAVRVSNEKVASPRLLLYDRTTPMNRAKVVGQTSASIVPSDYYNPDSDSYDTANNFQYEKAGVYNYPMYFDAMFEGNLYDRFHDSQDNPLKSLDTHQSFEFNTDLCCEALTVLGIGNGDFVKIGYVIKIEERNGYDVFGRIESVEVDYSNNIVTIKGKVIKK